MRIPKVVILVVLIIFVCLVFIGQDELLGLMKAELLELDPWLAISIYLVSFVVGTLLLLPASAFLLLSGAMFGYVEGAILGMTGFIAGATTAFVTSRYLLHDFVVQRIPSKVSKRILDIHSHGWQLVAVLRVSGFIPSGVINYALAVTSVKVWDFVWASFLFTLPAGLALVYAGSLGRQALDGKDIFTILVGLLVLVVLCSAGAMLRRFVNKGQSIS